MRIPPAWTGGLVVLPVVLAACATIVPPHAQPIGSHTVTVSCTTTQREAEPCISQARDGCQAPSLSTVHVNATPYTSGVEGTQRSLFQYEATYRCEP